jgi:hypothetical protein
LGDKLKFVWVKFSTLILPVSLNSKPLLDPCKPREMPPEHRRQSDQNQSRNKARIEESNRNKFNFSNFSFDYAWHTHSLFWS